MKILISTNDFEHDPEFNRLLGAYASAKMQLIVYFHRAMDEDLSRTSVKEQVLTSKDGE